MKYLLISNLSLIILSTVLVPLLPRLKFFSINRIFIILMPLLALVIPLISLPASVVGYRIELPLLNVGQVAAAQEVSSSISLIDALLVGYGLISILMFIFFIRRFIGLVQFMRQLEWEETEGGVMVSKSPSEIQAFSFFNYIYIGDRKDADEIERHELLHYRLMHSLDNLFFELMRCVFWFNPAIYQLQRSARANHEFQVDSLLAEENADEYIQLMANSNDFLRELSICNSYHSNSNLLKRIKMLHQKPNKPAHKSLYLLLIPALVFSIYLVSCSEEENPPPPPPPPTEEVISGEEFKNLTTKPDYPGGMQEMITYLGSNIVYPAEAKEAGVEGVVYVQFIIREDGSIDEATVMKGVNEQLDAEALRAVNSMPDWTPGEKDGKKVSVQYMLPISFKIDPAAGAAEENAKDAE